MSSLAQNCVDTWFAAETYPEAELGAFKMGFTNCLEELRRLASYVGETEGLPAEAAGLEERFREFVDLFVSYMSPKPDVRRQALRRPTALRRSRGVREALRTGLTRTL